MRRFLVSLALLALPVVAHAQDEPMPPGHPHVEGAPHGGGGRSPFDAPPVATAEPSADVPVGSIRVTVTDAEGHPVAGAPVILGTMAQGGDRDRVSAMTDASGRHVWADLDHGSSQAYRVNVPHEGATYSCTPFQLPTDRGYDVHVVRLPVTHDDRTVLQLIGQTFVEIRNERLHVIQQAQLANMSETPQTYVFPEGGLRIGLPEGFTAFQSQPVMTDQRVEELADRGLRIRGSLPPGRVTLTWAYDLPITGSDMDVELSVPFRTYIYRVITDAPPGMTLDLDGLPDAQEFEDDGRHLLGSEVQRRPGDAPFESFTMHFRGIPGPGPMRWIAVALALGMVLVGSFFVVRGGSTTTVARKSREQRRDELLEEAARLEADAASGEVGPQYRQKRHDAIVRELAVLLHAEREEQATERTRRSETKKNAPHAEA